MANIQDDGYLSVEDRHRAIAMIGNGQGIPHVNQDAAQQFSDLQERERMVLQKEQELNARLAQHDKKVNAKDYLMWTKKVGI